MKKILLLTLTLLGSSRLILGQFNPPNSNAPQAFNLTAPPPIAVGPLSVISNNPVGSGQNSFCYWVVARYKIGNAIPSPQTCIQNIASTSTVTISWSSPSVFTTGFDVVRTSTVTSTFPANPSCANCLISSNQAGVSFSDTLGAGGSYSATTFGQYIAHTFLEIIQNPFGVATGIPNTYPIVSNDTIWEFPCIQFPDGTLQCSAAVAGTGTVTSISCTSPIVCTPSPITGIGTVSFNDAAIFYQTVKNSANTSQTQRPILKFIQGANVTLTVADNAGNTSTDITIASTGGSSTEVQVNGVDTTAQTPINFINSAAFNGLTLQVNNPAAGNVQPVFSGTLGNGGLTNSSVTYNGQAVALGASGNVNPGNTAHTFALNEGNGNQIGATNLCTNGQVPIGQTGADPICQTISGDITINNAGATTVVNVNGAVVPTSATVIASNASKQLIAAPLASTNVWVGSAGNLPVARALSQDLTLGNTGVATVVGVNAASVPVSASLTGTNASSQIIAATSNSLTAAIQCVPTSASGTAYVCNTTPTFTPGAGSIILFKADVASGVAPTLNVNSEGAHTIKKLGVTTSLTTNDLVAAQWVWMARDATNTVWQLLSPADTVTIPTGSTFSFVSPAQFILGICQVGTPLLGISTPSSNNPSSICLPLSGTNTTSGAVQFTATTQSFQHQIRLPDDWVSGSGNDIVLKFSDETDNNNAHTEQFNFSTACAADGGTLNPAFNAAQTFSSSVQSVAATANTATLTTFTTTGCSAGNILFFKLGLDSGRTATGNADAITVIFKLKRTVTTL